MTQYSISSLLSLQKTLSTRRNQLSELKGSSTTRYIYRTEDRIEEPVYDIKKLDKKVVALNNAIFKVDQKIKEVNAKTMTEIDINYDELMSGLE